MTPERVLVFDLTGDYAQFRKFFTNMSPLTFSIPPRTVISGILGAIAGIDKEENPEIYSTENSFVSLRILKPIKKTKIAHNYLKTTSLKMFSRFDEHKPTNIEFLKDVGYRIYFSHQDSVLYMRIKDLLEKHASFYTISLGISGCLANYNYIGEFDVEKNRTNECVNIHSVIPMEIVKDIDFSNELHLQKATIPIDMKNDREVTKYSEILYEMNGLPIPVILNEEFLEVKKLNERIHGI
jgi:CRISPR-associated protein Cas5h